MISVLINTHLLMAARDAAASSGTSIRPRRVSTRPTSRRGLTWRRWWRRTPIRPCRRTATAGRSCSASACAGISARTSGSRREWRAITTSTVRTAPTKAGARRRPRRSAGRSSRRRWRATTEIEVWGDGEQTRSFMYIDDCLYGTRTLMAERRARADQYRQRRARHDQPVDRHRRRNRRASGSSGGTIWMRRKACAAAAATTRSSSRSSVGRPRSGCATVFEKTYRWIHDQMAAPAGARRAYA